MRRRFEARDWEELSKEESRSCGCYWSVERDEGFHGSGSRVGE